MRPGALERKSSAGSSTGRKPRGRTVAPAGAGSSAQPASGRLTARAPHPPPAITSASSAAAAAAVTAAVLASHNGGGASPTASSAAAAVSGRMFPELSFGGAGGSNSGGNALVSARGGGGGGVLPVPIAKPRLPELNTQSPQPVPNTSITTTPAKPAGPSGLTSLAGAPPTTGSSAGAAASAGAGAGAGSAAGVSAALGVGAVSAAAAAAAANAALAVTSSGGPKKRTLVVVNGLAGDNSVQLEEAFRLLTGGADPHAAGATVSADDIARVMRSQLGYELKNVDALRRAFRATTNNHERISFSKFRVLLQAEEQRRLATPIDPEYDTLLSYGTVLGAGVGGGNIGPGAAGVSIGEGGAARLTPHALRLAFQLAKPPVTDQQFNDLMRLVKLAADGTFSYRELVTKLLSNKN